MRSLRHSLILVSPLFQAIVLISTALTPAFALASPVSFPMPFMNADYGNHLASIPHATRRIIPRYSYLHDPSEHSKAVSSKHRHSAHTNSSSLRYHHTSRASYQTSRIVRRDDMESLFENLSTHGNNAMSDSQDLRKETFFPTGYKLKSSFAENLASQSSSFNNVPNFQQNAVTKFSSFQTSIQAFVGILSQLAADKGLANYDKNDQLETLLKDVINATKNVLSAVYILIENDPTLGPLLGPSTLLHCSFQVFCPYSSFSSCL